MGGRQVSLTTGDKSRPLGVVLVGAGMVAGTHLAAIAEAKSHVRLCGVLARRRESATALLEKLPQDYGWTPKVYETVDQVAQDAGVDAIIVVTPPNVRADLIAPLVQSGKHILLEKPIARNQDEAAAIVDLCEQAGVELGIVFQHRFRAASQTAKDLVESGRLGQLGMAEVSIPWWRDQSYYDELGRGTYARDGGGVLISQAIHTIDLMLSLTGPVSRVQAMTATSRFHKMEAEDFVSAGFEFANGAVGSFSASTCSFPGSAETITLHFEKGSLRLEAGVMTVTWCDGNVETFGAVAGTGGGADPMAFTHAWHQSVIEDFSDAMRTGRSPLVTGREALASHHLIHAIEQSGQQGRAVEVIQ